MISVIITTVNRYKCLKKAISAVLEQTYPDFEIIVADDGSTDNTPQVKSQFNDSHIHYVCFEENQGYLKNFNNGLKHCTGEFVITLSDDDMICDSRFFENAMTAFNSSETIDILFGRQKIVSEDGEILKRFPFKPEYSGREFFSEWSSLSDYLSFSAFLFKTSLIRKAKVFQVDLPYVYTADWSAILKTALLARKIVFYDQYVYAWTKTSDQQISGNHRGNLIEEMFTYLSFPHDIIQLNETYHILDTGTVQSWCNQQVTYINSAVISNYYLHHNQKIFKRFLKKQDFHEKEIYIYGYGDLGTMLNTFLSENGIGIRGFIDDFRMGENILNFEYFIKTVTFPAQVILATYKHEFAYAMLNKLRKIPDIEITDLFLKNIN